MKKINILLISGISAVILFFVLTLVESKIINHEEMKAVYIATEDIYRDMKILENNVRQVFVPAHLVFDTGAIVNAQDLRDKYVKETINKGQIIFNQDIASKEQLKIIETENGLEKIALKIKAAENAIAYQVKPKDRVHLYFTGKINTVRDILSRYEIEVGDSGNDNSLFTSKLLENIEILGIYDEIGRDYGDTNFGKLDTIVIAVKPKVAQMINNLRNQGTFDITG